MPRRQNNGTAFRKRRRLISVKDQPVLVLEPLPQGFSLGAVVCSYGFSMLAPNVWHPWRAKPRADAKGDELEAATPSKKRSRSDSAVGESTTSPQPRLSLGQRRRRPEGELERPLRRANGRSVHVLLKQPKARRLEVHLHRRSRRAKLSGQDVVVLHQQVVRMLRLEGVNALVARQFTLANKDLANRGPVGRLFRSPSLFEDFVKTFTLCNCGWGRSISMNRMLCRVVGHGGAFPTAEELSRCPPSLLRKRCGVGYRAERIVRLARAVVAGHVDLAAIESAADADRAMELCRSIHGFGPFGAANALQLLGHYETIPADSETVRHLSQARGLRSCSLENVRAVAARVYKRYAPFQFMRYWTELWQTYEDRMGARAYEVSDSDNYRLLTASQMNVAKQQYASSIASTTKKKRLS